MLSRKASDRGLRRPLTAKAVESGEGNRSEEDLRSGDGACYERSPTGRPAKPDPRSPGQGVEDPRRQASTQLAVYLAPCRQVDWSPNLHIPYSGETASPRAKVPSGGSPAAVAKLPSPHVDKATNPQNGPERLAPFGCPRLPTELPQRHRPRVGPRGGGVLGRLPMAGSRSPHPGPAGPPPFDRIRSGQSPAAGRRCPNPGGGRCPSPDSTLTIKCRIRVWASLLDPDRPAPRPVSGVMGQYQAPPAPWTEPCRESGSRRSRAAAEGCDAPSSLSPTSSPASRPAGAPAAPVPEGSCG